jgi:thiosulfate dehydrogenase
MSVPAWPAPKPPPPSSEHNMPVGFRENFPLGQGGLSDQEAVDVADYFSHMPRPTSPHGQRLARTGTSPKDAR